MGDKLLASSKTLTLFNCYSIYSSTFKKPKKKELVIPLITKNRWRVPDARVSNGGCPNEDTQHLETLAAEEIIKETQEASQGWENRGNSASSTLEIPLFMQNRVPSGYETDNKVDVTLRAEQVCWNCNIMQIKL